MGNQNSATTSPAVFVGPSFSNEALRIGRIRCIEDTFNDFHTKEVDCVAHAIANIYVVFPPDETSLPHLAKAITHRAVANRALCGKYVELATKLFSSLSFKNLPNAVQLEIGNFMDVFIQHVIKTFDDFALPFGDLHKDHCYALFFGELYSQDMISSTLISYFLRKLNHRPKDRELLLIAIKEKVLKEYLNSKSENEFIEMLFKGNLMVPEQDLDS